MTKQEQSPQTDSSSKATAHLFHFHNTFLEGIQYNFVNHG